jgi:hypothetical protein
MKKHTSNVEQLVRAFFGIPADMPLPVELKVAYHL